MPTRRTSENERGYLGEPIGSALAAWMNRDKGSLTVELTVAGPDWRTSLSENVKKLVDRTKGKRRVNLPLDIAAKKRLLSELGSQNITFGPESPSPAAVKRVEEIIDLLQAAYLQPGSRGSIFALLELNARLSSYKLKSQVNWTSAADLRDNWGERCAGDEGRICLICLVPQDRNGESAAIWRLFELSRQGLFHRLRRCSWCKRWLFAHFNSQLFCSAKCRKAHRERSEDYKAYRRKKARQYYERKAYAKKR